MILGLLLLAPTFAKAEERATLRTTDGATWVGAILAETKEGYLFKPDGGPARVIPFASIVELQHGTSANPATAPQAPAPAQPGQGAPPQPSAAVGPSTAPPATPTPPTPSDAAPAPAPAPPVVTAPPPAPKVPVFRPGLIAYLAAGADLAFAFDPALLYPHATFDGLLGGRFGSSGWGLAGSTDLALGTNGFSPSLGLNLSEDFSDNGTIYAGLAYPLDTSELCVQAIGQAASGSAFMFRASWCGDSSSGGSSHFSIGLGWGFGT